MDINLERADLLQLDPISNTCTTKLLPLGKSRKVSNIIYKLYINYLILIIIFFDHSKN
jgi:hypothetical protein